LCNEDVYFADGFNKDTAYFLDLPSCDGVEEGLALARLGYRPIPLYNGTHAQKGVMALVDNSAIAHALLWGAEGLKTLIIANDAPPAFLLDSNRMHRHKPDVSVFDNSYDIYAQDIPSAEYFQTHGIKQIVVRGHKIHEDLSKILYGFQNKGIKILFTEGFELPRVVLINKVRNRYFVKYEVNDIR